MVLLFYLENKVTNDVINDILSLNHNYFTSRKVMQQVLLHKRTITSMKTMHLICCVGRTVLLSGLRCHSFYAHTVTNKDSCDNCILKLLVPLVTSWMYCFHSCMSDDVFKEVLCAKSENDIVYIVSVVHWQKHAESEFCKTCTFFPNCSLLKMDCASCSLKWGCCAVHHFPSASCHDWREEATGLQVLQDDWLDMYEWPSAA